MPRWHDDMTDEGPIGPLAVAGVGLVVLGVAVAFLAPLLVPVVLVISVAAVVMDRRRRAGLGLQIHQIDELREAELALAVAGSTEAAAGQLAENAIALLGASSATVLIEGIGDTVRVTAGDATGSVYGPGSRMRLLDDDGIPCGSIAVSARADGRPYTPQQEHMLDALAQRISSTLHRLSLFTEVQAERETLADVVGSSSDGIFSVGPDRTVRSWNPAMATLTGVPVDDALKRPIASVFQPVNDDGPVAPGEMGGRETALLRLPARKGQRTDGDRWLLCSWSPLPEGGSVVVVRDDTERKRLQDDKDGWISQVSHELRTPLTPIKGFLHTLQRREEQLTEEDRHRIYDVMLREEQRLENLVNGLLQATSMGTGTVEVEVQVVDWPTLVADQVELYARADPTREIRVVVEPGIGPVLVDPMMASGVLGNLLSNALKYSPVGSPLDVCAKRDCDEVVTAVSDCGPGVAAADRERIFEKFTRLGDHLTRPQQGIGLGLYIARRSVEQLGGSLWCDERPGGGARFSFRLPIGTVAEPPPAPKPRRRTKALTAT
jgi:signal transduction histidine kinase